MSDPVQNRNERTPVLEIENLCVSYFTRAGEIPAVVDFSLSLQAGESVGIVGESGCGKSTVAMAIMQYLGSNGGVVRGSIRFQGRELTQMDAEDLRQLRGSRIAMIYQEPMAALNPVLTIGSQLMEVPLTHCDASPAQARKQTLDMLHDVHLPDPERIMDAYPHQISGGQQQRVVIAMALLGNPDLLLLDEPTTALDVTVEAGIVSLISELSRKHETALLFISHNLGLVMEVCDRISVMYAGEIVEGGPVSAIFNEPRHPYTRGLLDCIPVPHSDKNARPLAAIPGQLPLPHERPQGCSFGPRCRFARPGECDAGQIALENHPIGDASARSIRCRRWKAIRFPEDRPRASDNPVVEPGDNLLSVEGVRKYYELRDNTWGALISGKRVHYVKANDLVSFQARASETIAIVGESGCGKSTLARVLMGLETANGGNIRFLGNEIGNLPVRERSPEQLAALQMVFQNPNETLNPSLTIGAQIGRVIRKFGIAGDADGVRDRVNRLLDTVKLPREFAKRKPRQLSGGQKQRVGIARAFAGNPAAVIADEPISALDVSVAAAVTELLMDIQREHRTALLFISHDLSVVRYLADQVVVMYLGQVMEHGTVQQVFSPPYHPYTEALLSAVPVADPNVAKRRIVLEGNPPSAVNPPVGCPFASRCPWYIGKICDDERPQPQRSELGHRIACHIPVAELQESEPVISLSRSSSTGA